MKPKSVPQIKKERAVKIGSDLGIDINKPFILGMRGYYLDSMGVKGKNDRGIYDDAIILVAPDVYITFNANTDPSRVRKGKGTGSGKGMAVLDIGVWSYKIGIHGLSKPVKSRHEALVQAAPVTVIRDGNPDYKDSGHFGINIHRGGVNTTSSEGCQTIPPDQWDRFLFAVKAAMNRFKIKEIPYVLVEEQG